MPSRRSLSDLSDCVAPMKPSGPICALTSPGQCVRAEVAVESVWIGSTVYPDCPVWRVWYDGRLVVDTSILGLLPKDQVPLGYAMTFLHATQYAVQTGLGPGQELEACFAGRDKRKLAVRIRLTEMSAFCAVGQPNEMLGQPIVAQDLSVTRFPAGSVLLGNTVRLDGEHSTLNNQRPTTNAQREGPQVRFAPSGKLIAFWRHGLEQHLVFFDRPADLAMRRFGAMARIEELNVADGRQGCEHLFLTVPFTKSDLPAPIFGEAVTPAYCAAFKMILARTAPPSLSNDDFQVLRGEPGEFAVAAQRQGDVWQVAGVTAEARTLTVRFEELWLRTPPELRVPDYTVAILRDPIKGEAGDRIEEVFTDQAPDVRVALDLAKSGGFLIFFRPNAQRPAPETRINKQ